MNASASKLLFITKKAVYSNGIEMNLLYELRSFLFFQSYENEKWEVDRVIYIVDVYIMPYLSISFLITPAYKHTFVYLTFAHFLQLIESQLYFRSLLL